MDDTRRPIRLVVSGLTGRTGSEVARVLARAPDVQVVAGLSRRPGAWEGIPLYPDLPAAMQARPEVLVDFTVAEVAEQLIIQALQAGIRPVVGTTGLSARALLAAEELCRERGLAAAVIPNFSLGAAVLFKLARLAYKVYPHCEILELHGAHKKDRPSGTALHLAAALDAGAGSVPIHSVRLPGLVAHQEVLFGGEGEVLTLRHDVTSRTAYAPGVLAVVRGIRDRVGLFRDVGAFLPGWESGV